MAITCDQVQFKKWSETLIAFNLGIQTGLKLIEEVENLPAVVRRTLVEELKRDIARELARFAYGSALSVKESAAEEFATEPIFITLGGQKVEKVYCT